MKRAFSAWPYGLDDLGLHFVPPGWYDSRLWRFFVFSIFDYDYDYEHEHEHEDYQQQHGGDEMYFPYQLTAMQQAVETRVPKMGNLGAPTAADLRDMVERQHLIIQSLLMLLIDKNVISEAELVRWIEFADPLDGRADGKLAPDKAPATCTKCGRVSPPSSARCMYCGAGLDTGVLDRRGGTKKVPPSLDGGK